MQSNLNTGGTPDPAELEVHPAAELFPLIEGAEFEELVADVRANGLRTPILLDREGRVLDGRNRLRACRAAGVEPRFETWEGSGSAFELVVSLNLRRRHLNESQRAMLAAQIRQRLQEEARKEPAGAATNWLPVEATEKAALLMNISPTSVRRAAQLLRSGDQPLIILVKKGEMPVSAAVEKLHEKSAPEPAASGVEGRFPILHAAPRWERQKFEKLAVRAVSEMAAEHAVLFLWAPDYAMELIRRWGFRYEASIVLRATRASAATPARSTSRS